MNKHKEHLMPNDNELWDRIEEVVHYIWDPIGICDIPDARNEYSAYVNEIYTRVKIGDEEKVLEYMKWVVEDRMGMAWNHESAKKSSAIMMIWRNKCMECA